MLNEILSPLMLWFIAAIAILGAEMLIGTYYLLALAFGAFAGGVCAMFTDTLDSQFTTAAIATLVSIILAFYYKKSKRQKRAPDSINANCLDAGAVITVSRINQDGSGSASYRGAVWSVKSTGGELKKDVKYVITDIKGSQLIVTAKD